MPKLLHWGYTIDHPTAANVAKYLGFTFGFKWLLIALALVLAGSLQRRFFLAALSLIAVAFSFQFTIEVLANQKFVHIWVIIANLFVAFASLASVALLIRRKYRCRENSPRLFSSC